MSKRINNFFYGEIIPDEILAGSIAVYNNVWPDSEYVIEAVENICIQEDSDIHWSRSSVIDMGHDQKLRTSYDIGITSIAENMNDPLMQNIHNQFYTILMAALESYKKIYKINIITHEPYNLLRYSPGEYYGSHFDGSTDTGRSVSAILYLNDNFDGGETHFDFFDLSIKPDPGKLVIFPSNYAYTHTARPVENGKKYVIVTWLSDRIINGY